MPAINFPTSPSLNDEYSFEGRTWLWNGTGWEVKSYPAALQLGTAAAPSLYFAGDTNTGIYSPGADQVAITTGGTGRLFVDADGDIGVGVETPTRQIDIATSNTAAGLGYTIRLRANATAGASAIQWTTSDASQTNGYIACDTSRDIYFASGSTERMRISLAGTTTITSNAATAPFIAKISTSEVARIDSSGRVLIGSSTARANFFNTTVSSALQVEGINHSTASTAITRNSADTGGPVIHLAKSRGSTTGSNTLVLSGDDLGYLGFLGSDGTEFVAAAGIYAQVDGAPGIDDMPGRLVFATTADGAGGPAERMRIDSSGQVRVAGLGSAAAPAIVVGGDVNTGLYSPGADQVAISTGGTGRLTVDTAAITSTLPVIYPLGAVGTPSLTFTGDLNTGMWSPAADTIAFSEGGAEAMRIDSSSRLLVGTSVAPINNPKISAATSNIESSLSLGQYRNSTSIAADLDFTKSRSGTVGTVAAVGTTDTIGQMRFYGAGDASTYVEAARITTAVDGGTVGPTSLAGRLVFSTTADGAAAPTERMRITSAGRVGIGTTSPDALLTVGGVGAFGAGSASAPSVSVTGDLNTGVYFPATDNVALTTAGTQKFTIDSLDGNAIIENSFPTIRPSLDLPFALTKTLDPRITFTRASTGTYVGSDGLIKSAAVNEARFDHDPTTGESLGLLVEESRTNQLSLSSGALLFTRSFVTVSSFTGSLVPGEVFTTANAGTMTLLAYTGGRAFFLAGSGDQNAGATPLVAASGSITAISSNNSNATNGNHSGVTVTAASVTSPTQSTITSACGKWQWTYPFSYKTAGTACICSLFVKVLSASVTKIYLEQQGGGDGDTYRTYTIATNSFNTVTGSGSGTGIQGVDILPNGWYRFYWGRSSMSGTGPAFIVEGRNSSDAVVSAGIYIDGGQIEEARFPTSYIPTSGSAVTRSADVASITGTNFSSWYRQDEGSVLAHSSTQVSSYLAHFYGSSGTQNRIALVRNSSGRGQLVAETNGISQATITLSGGDAISVSSKLAAAYKINDFSLAQSSFTGVDTSGTPDPTINKISIGSLTSGASNFANGTISRLAYWPIRLSDTTLRALTAS